MPKEVKPKKPKSEAVIQREVKKALEAVGWIVTVVTIEGIPMKRGRIILGYRKNPLKGMTDLILNNETLNQYMVYMEIKTEIGQLQPEQKVWRKRIELSGHPYYLIRSVKDLKKYPELGVKK